MKPYVIGLDLGGTNSVFGIVDSRGEIKATTAIKTQAYADVKDYVNASVGALQIIIDQVGGIDKIKGMGIGAPNGNYYKGTIEFAPNLTWGHNGVVPLADMFSKALGIPVGLTNDANAAAIGEMAYGVARGMKNFIEVGAIHQVCGAAKELDGRLFAERAFRAQHGHALRRFKRQAGGHDFAPDGGHVGALERPGVGGLDLLDYLRHAIGAEEGRAFAFLISPTRSATSARWFSSVSSCWSMLSICTRRLASSGEACGLFMND